MNKAKILILFFILLFTKNLYSNIEFFQISQLKPGMKGYLKTVISGRKIEKINIEILGILSNSKLNDSIVIKGKSILIKLNDKKNQKVRIFAGMSGSPVFIKNKLVGAISSTWVNTDHKIGIVTPIFEMLNLWKFDEIKEKEIDKSNEKDEINIDGKIYDNFIETNSYEDAKRLDKKLENSMVFYRANSPLYISGLNPITKKRVEKKFKDFTLVNQSSAIGISDTKLGTKELQPGSAIGIQLARGDINITSLGTLTYFENDHFLALGHHFLKKGFTNYFFTNAHIYHSIYSKNLPFKIGAPLDVIGKVTQDRLQGVSGKLGQFPDKIPVNILITDKDINKNEKIKVDIIHDNDMLEEILTTITFQSIDNIINRVGKGTCKISFVILLENNKQEVNKIEFSNVYFSDSDITSNSTIDLLEALNIIRNNEFEEVKPVGIDIYLEYTEKKDVMKLKDVKFDKKSFMPGEIIEMKLIFKKFRGKEIVKNAYLLIPINTPYGTYNLSTTCFGETVTGDMDSIDKKKNIEVTTSLNEQIENFEKKKKNNEIKIELTSLFVNKKDKKDSDSKSDSFIKLEMDGIVTGFIEKEIIISNKKGKK